MRPVGGAGVVTRTCRRSRGRDCPPRAACGAWCPAVARRRCGAVGRLLAVTPAALGSGSRRRRSLWSAPSAGVCPRSARGRLVPVPAPAFPRWCGGRPAVRAASSSGAPRASCARRRSPGVSDATGALRGGGGWALPAAGLAVRCAGGCAYARAGPPGRCRAGARRSRDPCSVPCGGRVARGWAFGPGLRRAGTSAATALRRSRRSSRARPGRSWRAGVCRWLWSRSPRPAAFGARHHSASRGREARRFGTARRADRHPTKPLADRAGAVVREPGRSRRSRQCEGRDGSVLDPLPTCRLPGHQRGHPPGGGHADARVVPGGQPPRSHERRALRHDPRWPRDPVWYGAAQGPPSRHRAGHNTVGFWRCARGFPTRTPRSTSTHSSRARRACERLAATDLHEFQTLPNGDHLLMSYPLKRGVDLTGLSGSPPPGPNSTIADCVVQDVSPGGTRVAVARQRPHQHRGREPVPREDHRRRGAVSTSSALDRPPRQRWSRAAFGAVI